MSKNMGRSRKAFHWGVATVAMAMASLSQSAFAQSDGANTQSQQSRGVEDIVVTAQKREQNLQDVPVSITALSQSSLVANRIQDVRDLSSVVPSLTVRPSGGGAQLPNYILRGIFTGGSSIGTDKGVALYIDGVYVQSATGAIFQMADIERIEVLKGPQGTLFGRNATGGAISVITRDPAGEFGVSQDLTYGNYNQFRSKTHVDLPQLGPLSLSATYLHWQRDGDLRNLGAGTRWDYGPATGGVRGVRTSPRTLGAENIEGVLVAAKLDLHPDWDISYKFDYSVNDYTADGVGVGYFPASFLTPLYLAQNPALRTPVSTQRPKAVNNAFTTDSFSKSFGHNLTVQYRVNDQITLKNILAYRSSTTRANQQLDGLGGLFNTPIPVGGGNFLPPAWFPGGNPGSACAVAVPSPACIQSIGQPFVYLVAESFNATKQWTNEFQVNIDTDWFSLTAGYLYFKANQRAGSPANTYNVPLLAALYGQGTTAQGTAYVIPRNPGYDPSRARITSHAFYLQPEIHLTDQIDLVLGARITRDRKVGFETFPLQPVTPAAVPINYRDTQVSYLAGLNYKPTDDILIYGKYSTGYISGGQLATISFAPEKASSWEAGVKADLMDGKLRTNLALFRVKYKSIQYATGGTLAGVPSAAAFGAAVVPSADARAYGFEWENTFVPIDGLTLGANIGYLNFKFDQNTIFGGIFRTTGLNCFGPQCLAIVNGDTAATGGFVAGSGAPGYQNFARPKWTGNLSAQYDTPEIISGGYLSFRVDGNFTSRTVLSSDITPGTSAAVGGTLVVAPADAAYAASATTGFRWIVNSRVALTDFDLGGVKSTLAVWGRNIFNNKDITQYVGLGPVSSVLYERARTYGVDLTVKF